MCFLSFLDLKKIAETPSRNRVPAQSSNSWSITIPLPTFNVNKEIPIVYVFGIFLPSWEIRIKVLCYGTLYVELNYYNFNF